MTCSKFAFFSGELRAGRHSKAAAPHAGDQSTEPILAARHGCLAMRAARLAVGHGCPARMASPAPPAWASPAPNGASCAYSKTRSTSGRVLCGLDRLYELVRANQEAAPAGGLSPAQVAEICNVIGTFFEVHVSIVDLPMRGAGDHGICAHSHMLILLWSLHSCCRGHSTAGAWLGAVPGPGVAL